MSIKSLLTRRTFLAAAAVGIPVVFAASRGRGGSSHTLAPTPSCDDGDESPTVEQTEGPYFTPDSPEKNDFRSDVDAGTAMVLTGAVLSTGCQPVPRALLDLWHADAGGAYDNTGYRLRGHLFTDSVGKFRVSTIVPGLYPGRTRHFHVKVQAPAGPVLTTQLYFPDEPANSADVIYRPELEMDVRRDEEVEGSFIFVVRT